MYELIAEQVMVCVMNQQLTAAIKMPYLQLGTSANTAALVETTLYPLNAAPPL